MVKYCKQVVGKVQTPTRETCFNSHHHHHHHHHVSCHRPSFPGISPPEVTVIPTAHASKFQAAVLSVLCVTSQVEIPSCQVPNQVEENYNIPEQQT